MRHARYPVRLAGDRDRDRYTPTLTLPNPPPTGPTANRATGRSCRHVTPNPEDLEEKKTMEPEITEVS